MKHPKSEQSKSPGKEQVEDERQAPRQVQSRSQSQTLSRYQRRSIGFLAQFIPALGRLITCQFPMAVEQHRFFRERQSETLFVLLPGIQDQPADFETAGFVAAAKQRDVKADFIAVDAHIGYYVRHSILDRLHQDIIEPAHASGYRRIWLVGTSLGGLGSALYAGRFETHVDGVVLLAPFLGPPSLIREIDRAGGPLHWRPQGVTNLSFQATLWAWLGRYFENPRRNPTLYLGFGEKDRFAFANGFLAEALSKDQVLSMPGGHDWSTWQRLWLEFLERFGAMP